MSTARKHHQSSTTKTQHHKEHMLISVILHCGRITIVALLITAISLFLHYFTTANRHHNYSLSNSLQLFIHFYSFYYFILSSSSLSPYSSISSFFSTFFAFAEGVTVDQTASRAVMPQSKVRMTNKTVSYQSFLLFLFVLSLCYCCYYTTVIIGPIWAHSAFSWAICSLSMLWHQFRLLKIQMTCAICVFLCTYIHLYSRN